jgi:hypothetical protein
MLEDAWTEVQVAREILDAAEKKFREISGEYVCEESQSTVTFVKPLVPDALLSDIGELLNEFGVSLNRQVVIFTNRGVQLFFQFLGRSNLVGDAIGKAMEQLEAELRRTMGTRSHPRVCVVKGFGG